MCDVRLFGELFAEGTRNGLTRPKAVRGAGVKMVNMGELFAYPRLRNAPMDRVPLSEAEARKSLVEPGDLLFARQSLVLEGAGKCSIFLSDDEPVTFESHITRVRLDSRKADPRFYFYYLQSHHGRAAITSIVEQGAGASGIRGSDLARLSVLWQPLPEQYAIADSLGALDDKIEQNRRTAQVLERLARAIFRAWFVDFEPVKAKAAGATAFPSMPQPVFDALPTRFVDSAIGAVPEGWGVGPFKEIGELTIGGQWGEDVQADGMIEATCLRGVDLERLRGVGIAEPPKRWLKAAALDKRRMDDRDVLIAASGAGPTGRSLWMCSALVKRWDKVSYSNFCKRIRCASSAHAVFLDAWLHEMRVSNEIWEHVNGTSIPNLDAGSLMNSKVIALPNPSLLNAFHNVVRPMWEFRFSDESRTLDAMRDYLLPKLLSGEVRVS